jgi:hypothetical protein
MVLEGSGEVDVASANDDFHPGHLQRNVERSSPRRLYDPA